MNDLGIGVTRGRILPSKLTRIRVQFSWNRPSFSRRDRFSWNHFRYVSRYFLV